MLKDILGHRARAPLHLHRALGTAAGWLSYLLSPSHARRLRENSAQSANNSNPREFNAVFRPNIAETDRCLTGPLVVRFRPNDAVRRNAAQYLWGYNRYKAPHAAAPSSQ